MMNFLWVRKYPGPSLSSYSHRLFLPLHIKTLFNKKFYYQKVFTRNISICHLISSPDKPWYFMK